MAGAKDRRTRRWIDPKWRHNLTNALLVAVVLAAAGLVARYLPWAANDDVPQATQPTEATTANERIDLPEQTEPLSNWPPPRDASSDFLKCPAVERLIARGRSLESTCRKTHCDNEADIATWTKEVEDYLLAELSVIQWAAFTVPPSQAWTVDGFSAGDPKLKILQDVHSRTTVLSEILQRMTCLKP